jgi:hypothetical protein
VPWKRGAFWAEVERGEGLGEGRRDLSSGYSGHRGRKLGRRRGGKNSIRPPLRQGRETKFSALLCGRHLRSSPGRPPDYCALGRDTQ